MPSYNYQCENCKSVFEQRHPRADIPKHNGVDRCAYCNGKLIWLFPCPAVIGTDTAYVADVGTGLENVGPFRRKQILAAARKAGISPESATYCPSLCAPGKPLDPAAFVPHSNAKAHIRRRCEELNYACEGVVNVKQREPESDPHEKPYRPAPDVVAQEVDLIVEREYGGSISAKKYADLTEAATEKLSGAL